MSWLVRMVRTVAIGVGGAAAAWYAWDRWQASRRPTPPRRPEPDAEDAEQGEVVEEIDDGDEVDDAEEVDEVDLEADVPDAPVTVRGVVIAEPTATLAFANEASDDELAAAGLSAPQRATVRSSRPFADLEALGATRGIGPKTLAALSRG